LSYANLFENIFKAGSAPIGNYISLSRILAFNCSNMVKCLPLNKGKMHSPAGRKTGTNDAIESFCGLFYLLLKGKNCSPGQARSYLSI
jgi:hypothetical protein